MIDVRARTRNGCRISNNLAGIAPSAHDLISKFCIKSATSLLDTTAPVVRDELRRNFRKRIPNSMACPGKAPFNVKLIEFTWFHLSKYQNVSELWTLTAGLHSSSNRSQIQKAVD